MSLGKQGKRLLALGFSGLLLMTSCGAPVGTGAQVVPGPTQTQVLSGEDIFTGIFFGQGQAATLFPEVWGSDQVKQAFSKMTAEDQAKFAQLQRTIVLEIRKTDGQFFDRFGHNMRSGNPAQVQAALTDAKVVLERLIPAREGKVSAQVCGPLFCVLGGVIHVAAAVTSYVFVVGAALVVGYVWVPDNRIITQATDGTTLYDDAWIGKVATRLKN